MKDEEGLSRKITPENIHAWYLNACSTSPSGEYNKAVQIPYNKLTDGQKHLDKYLANQINELIEFTYQELIKDFTSDDINSSSDYFPPLTCIKIINKRFGKIGD